ncbi:MAG: SDR family NAD(P)-dependent oxidoreductase [Solirubrobacteraceae bacterium]
MSLPSPQSEDTVVITGASAGIGTELARQLASRGHNVTLVARREDRLTELAEELRLSNGVVADIHPCDLGDDTARARLIETVKGGERQVAALCNNAGYGSFGAFHELELGGEVRMVRLNVLALHELTGSFLPPMVERGSGAVLNVASVAAFQPLPHNATYAATKAFVHSFSEAISAELHGTGVSVTSLCPGPVETEFGEVAGIGELESRIPEFIAQSAADVARSGIEAMVKGKRSVFPGMAPRVAAFSGRFAPRSALLPVAARVTDRALRGRR